MVSVTVVVCVTPPPVPVTVIVRVPVLTRRLTWMLIADVPAPGAAMELGLKLIVTLLPPPEADRLIAELNPPEIAVVIVDLPVPPGDTLRDEGDALIVKFGFVPVTVNVTVVVSTVLPDVPFTVIVYFPAATDAPTVSVIVELPAPVMVVGLKPTVTPLGCPLADSVIAELNPPVTALVIVELPACPRASETDAGDADKLNPGLDELPASAAISPAPCGLPHPVAKSYPEVAE
jgi:hypothetical protein